MSILHDAYTALLSGLTYKENGKIKWVDKYNDDIWITIINVDKEEYCVEYVNGSKYWYQNDKLHRLDGPAVKYDNGDKAWYQNGLLHRLDGHAVKWASGDKDWYINGESLTEEEFNKVKNELIT